MGDKASNRLRVSQAPASAVDFLLISHTLLQGQVFIASSGSACVEEIATKSFLIYFITLVMLYRSGGIECEYIMMWNLWCMVVYGGTIKTAVYLFETKRNGSCYKILVVCFLLGNSPAPEVYMPTFRNTFIFVGR